MKFLIAVLLFTSSYSQAGTCRSAGEEAPSRALRAWYRGVINMNKHKHGPESPQVLKKIQQRDDAIKELEDSIWKAGKFDVCLELSDSASFGLGVVLEFVGRDYTYIFHKGKVIGLVQSSVSRPSNGLGCGSLIPTED